VLFFILSKFSSNILSTKVSISTRAKLLRGFMVQDGCQMTSGDSGRMPFSLAICMVFCLYKREKCGNLEGEMFSSSSQIASLW